MAPADEHNMNGATISPTKLNKQDQEDLDATNASVDRMRKCLPDDPYFLTIPQDVEPRYHHQNPINAFAWLAHTPFHSKEYEALQYQTYHYHDPSGNKLYRQHPTRMTSPDYANMNAKDTLTGANTPNAVPKKTMSLSAYKKNRHGGTPDVAKAKDNEDDLAVKKPAVKGPVERLKADEEVLAAVEDDDELVPPTMAEEKKDLKRKRGDSLVKEVDSAPQPKPQATEETQHTAKKLKRSPSPSKDVDKQEREDTVQSDLSFDVKPKDTPVSAASQLMTMPPRLSPPPSITEDSVLPPRLSPIEDTDTPSLPSRLSPTIPANIAATLNARALFQATTLATDLSAIRSTSADRDARHLTPPRNTDGVTKKHKSPVPRNAFRANSSSPAMRSDTEERGRAVTSMPPKPKTSDVDASDSDGIVVNRAAKFRSVPDPSPEKKSLMVTLKLKKAIRDRAMKILKVRPQPGKGMTPEVATDTETKPRRISDARNHTRDRNAKGVAQKVGPTKKDRNVAASPELKRSRVSLSDDEDGEETSQPKQKRPRPDTGSKRPDPSTPPKHQESELLSPSSAQRPTPSSQQLTPGTMRKEILSAAVMKRETSHDSHTDTPPAFSQTSPPNTTAQPATNGTPKPKSQPWEVELMRLQTIGRDLKHAAQAHHTTSLTSQSTTEKKLAAIKAIESVLAYMLAFTCGDEMEPRRYSTKNWKDLYNFSRFPKQMTEPFAPLHGLVCWLYVVCNAHMLELFTKQPIPIESPERERMLKTLFETQAAMHRAAQDAESKLDIDSMMSTFPKTWAGRSKVSLPVETLESGNGKGFAGPYKLPLGVQTTPLRAARAAYKMMEEWIAKEGGVDGYVMKLRL